MINDHCFCYHFLFLFSVKFSNEEEENSSEQGFFQKLFSKKEKKEKAPVEAVSIVSLVRVNYFLFNKRIPLIYFSFAMLHHAISFLL